jgi:hypothetical protein
MTSRNDRVRRAAFRAESAGTVHRIDVTQKPRRPPDRAPEILLRSLHNSPCGPGSPPDIADSDRASATGDESDRQDSPGCQSERQRSPIPRRLRSEVASVGESSGRPARQKSSAVTMFPARSSARTFAAKVHGLRRAQMRTPRPTAIRRPEVRERLRPDRAGCS